MSDREEVREMLARYVRATDSRDGAAMARLFASDAKVHIFHGHGASAARLGQLDGAEAIGNAVSAMMDPHPPGGWSHHTTHDSIISIEGDRATMDAQFIVFSIRPPTSVLPIESGYYRSELVRVDGSWRFVSHRIDLDVPPMFAR